MNPRFGWMTLDDSRRDIRQRKLDCKKNKVYMKSVKESVKRISRIHLLLQKAPSKLDVDCRVYYITIRNSSHRIVEEPWEEMILNNASDGRKKRNCII